MKTTVAALVGAFLVLAVGVSAQYTSPFYADLQVVWPQPRSWERVRRGIAYR
jgi:hypothetical protein